MIIISGELILYQRMYLVAKVDSQSCDVRQLGIDRYPTLRATQERKRNVEHNPRSQRPVSATAVIHAVHV